MGPPSLPQMCVELTQCQCKWLCPQGEAAVSELSSAELKSTAQMSQHVTQFLVPLLSVVCPLCSLVTAYEAQRFLGGFSEQGKP
jgi:hypothetical protein